jgi:toxin ParE1/3/4
MINLVLRQTAERDIEGGFDYYLNSAGGRVAEAFVLAVKATLAHIGKLPRTGSTRYGELFDTPGLRSWLGGKFPYILFYIERERYLDVFRILRQRTDIPAQLQADLPDMEREA